ncbi:MAG: DUF5915 domain-containing protein, partial [Micrococcales bacterium]
GGNLIVTEQGIREGMRQFILPLWNTYYFFSLYANAAGVEAKRSFDSKDVLDRYLLSKTKTLIGELESDFNRYDATAATARLRDFADVLTNWYVRRSRDRFWNEDQDAFNTLYTVLEILCRVAAPLAPMVTEEIWKGLTGGRSVHLTEWPLASDMPGDDELAGAMDAVRTISSVSLALRKTNGLRVRLPLSELTVVTQKVAALGEFADLIADELNVKKVTLVELSLESTEQFGVVKRLSVNARAAGPRLGKNVQSVIQAAKAGDWSEANGVVTAGGVALEAGEYEMDLVANLAEGVSHDERVDYIGILPTGGFVILDAKVTPALAAEGLARDVIRAVQQARKDADFDVSDRIKLSLSASQSVLDSIANHQELIKGETLSVELSLTVAEVTGGVEVGEGEQVAISVAKL